MVGQAERRACPVSCEPPPVSFHSVSFFIANVARLLRPIIVVRASSPWKKKRRRRKREFFPGTDPRALNGTIGCDFYPRKWFGNDSSNFDLIFYLQTGRRVWDTVCSRINSRNRSGEIFFSSFRCVRLEFYERVSASGVRRRCVLLFAKREM